ncbi:MAG: hypothetical protein ACLP50_25420 [Solirubrobacteraceae bacterium]
MRFWDGILAALQTTSPHVGIPVQVALHSPGTSVQDHVLPLLINDLTTLSEPVVLVLDDYHAIENPQIHGQIERLIERLPATTHLVIAARSDPPLPLSRFRARGQLTEIRAADLRFSLSEAAAFLNHVIGLCLDDEEVTRLYERTEGWAAGLQLAGLSLKGRDDHRQFIDSFAGDTSRSWTTSASRCSTTSLRSRASSSNAVRFWSGSRDRCAQRSPGALTPSFSCVSSSARTSSSWHVIQDASGIATTICSPSCCATSSRAARRRSCPSCTGAHRRGTATRERSTKPSGTRRLPASSRTRRG